MLAVGGGGSPVRATCCCCFCEGVACLRLSGLPLGLGLVFGDSPPYFSSSCWVELYLVATLSFSMVWSRCLFSSSRWRWLREMRYSKRRAPAVRTPYILEEETSY